MTTSIMRCTSVSLGALGAVVDLPRSPSTVCASTRQDTLLAIPDRLVVLNLDDGTKSDISHVAPVLRRYGFCASFYVTDILREVKQDAVMTWDEIRELSEEGFEIGNHTKNHPNVTQLSKQQILYEIEGIELRCRENGIPVPTTFVYPGFHCNLQSAEVLLDKGYLFARRGVDPEFPYAGLGGRGPAYDPKIHHPLFLPTTGYAGPDWHLEDLIWAVDQATDGKIAILCFHGVPYLRAPWVSVEPQVFDQYMAYLHDRQCTVIATRDLVKYVNPAASTEIPFRPGSC